MITDIEQETLDIDWFFTDGNEIAFVASGGGRLPFYVSNKSMEEIESIAEHFKDLPIISEVVINPDIDKFITRGTNKREYLSYFVEIAEKGLFSFDKSISNSFSDLNYHLVAKPITPLKFDELPLEIANGVARVSIDLSNKNGFNIDSF